MSSIVWKNMIQLAYFKRNVLSDLPDPPFWTTPFCTVPCKGVWVDYYWVAIQG